MRNIRKCYNLNLKFPIALLFRVFLLKACFYHLATILNIVSEGPAPQMPCGCVSHRSVLHWKNYAIQSKDWLEYPFSFGIKFTRKLSCKD